MGLFNRKPEDKSDVATPDVQSDESTPVQSGTPSMRDPEKANTAETAVDGVNAQSQEGEDGDNAAEKKIEAIQEDEEQNEEEKDYPKAMQLLLITLALCLSGRLLDALERSTRLLNTCICSVLHGIGQHHHIDCYPTNHGRISCHQRCWLVRIVGQLFRDHTCCSS